MDKKIFALAVMIFVIASLCRVSFAADEKKAAPARPMMSQGQMRGPTGPQGPMMPGRGPNLNMVGGIIESIDTSDPANVKVTIKEDMTGAARTVLVAPWTNVTKITDVSELKAGDSVKVMLKKTGDTEMAMGIMFGNIKNMKPMRQMPPPKKSK